MPDQLFINSFHLFRGENNLLNLLQVCSSRGLHCSTSINTGWGVDQGKTLQKHLATFNSSILGCPFTQKEDPWCVRFFSFLLSCSICIVF